MRGKLFTGNIPQHNEHALEGMYERVENLRKNTEDNLKNVEGSNDVRKSFHGLNILAKINRGNLPGKYFFDESPKNRGRMPYVGCRANGAVIQEGRNVKMHGWTKARTEKYIYLCGQPISPKNVFNAKPFAFLPCFILVGTIFMVQFKCTAHEKPSKSQEYNHHDCRWGWI